MRFFSRAAPCCVLLTAFLAAPAAAELKVTVSRTVTGRFESVGVTVVDPLGGLDASGKAPTVTMADSSDHRESFTVVPGARPGEWTGRFTPLRTGRYTGTAVLERGHSKEIGLVPLIRVQASARPGFLRLHPTSRRTLQWTSGQCLFPIGVRVPLADFRPETDWRAELGRLRARGVNFVDVPVAWPGALPDEEAAAAARLVDFVLLEAELLGGMGVQLRLLPPEDLSEGAAAYEEQLRRWAARWSYSPALAAWLLAGAREELAPADRARFVRAVRAADPYRHLVAVPGRDPAAAGADLAVSRADWERPAHSPALLEIDDAEDAPTPLPGETSWQMLVVGGLGLPLYPYRPGTPVSQFLLDRLSRMAGAAGSVPYQLAPAPVSGLAAPDAPASFSRYGNVWLGWLAPDARLLDLTGLPRGRYRARFWDAGSDTPLGEKLVWSEGQGARLELPAGPTAVYVQVEPAPAPAVKPAPNVKKPITRAKKRSRRRR